MIDRLFVYLQYVLPRHALTALVRRIAGIRIASIKNALINGFVKLYKVQTAEVAANIPDDFATFNDFFTRELKAEARPLATAKGTVVSPVDGTVSVASALHDDSLIQAKGIDYTLDDLFAIDLAEAREYANGNFATIYLAPYNYHRVHMPVAGQLVAAHYVPGDLFSVNQATVRHLPGLFRRNERLNLHFKTRFGPMALIFVGALNVGSISTPWSGTIRPKKSGVAEPLSLEKANTELEKGDLLGWFNMGSTVILLFPRQAAEWHENLQPGRTLKMGEAIGTVTGSD